jgi:hypothetical protein
LWNSVSKVKMSPSSQLSAAGGPGDAPVTLAADTIIDFVTALRALPSSGEQEPHIQAKLVVRTHDGMTTRPAGQAYWFRGTDHLVSCLTNLADVLERLSRDRYTFVVLGQIIAGTNREEMHRRSRERINEKTGKKEPATLQQVAHHYVLLDLEDIDLPSPTFDQFVDPKGTVKYVVDLLPPEFRGVACWYQFTGSAGIKPGVRLRLAFWLNRALTLDELKWWLAHTRYVDKSVFRVAQPNYTANPVFSERCKDPLEGRCARSGMVPGETDVVVVPQIERPTPAQRAAATGRTDYVPAESFADALAAIGDHEGGQGCFGALERAIWTYTYERKGESNAGELYELLANRVREAQWNPKAHPLGHAIEKLDSNRGLIQVACGHALERARERAEREANASGFVPIGSVDGEQEITVTLAEGDEKLAEVLAVLLAYPPAEPEKQSEPERIRAMIKEWKTPTRSAIKATPVLARRAPPCMKWSRGGFGAGTPSLQFRLI